MPAKIIKRRFWLTFLIATILPMIAQYAKAHEVRPAFLEIREIAHETYDVSWRTPLQGDRRLALDVDLPANCQELNPRRFIKFSAAVEQKWQSRCQGGLAGKTIEIKNLRASLTDAILRYTPLNGSVKILRILGSEPTARIPEKQSKWDIATTYTGFGIEHILSGIDHLLFVFCLLLAIGFHKQLLWAITAFTVAHSITLALTTLNLLRLPASPTEALIALSIVYLAKEVHKGNLRQLTASANILWIGAFGLLHGLGFAGALRDIGLPENDIPAALLFFNLGIELGQLFFILGMLCLFIAWRKYASFPTANVTKLFAYMIGITASYWFIQRTVLVFVS